MKISTTTILQMLQLQLLLLLLQKPDHQNYRIIEINKNTKKSPGNPRKLTVSQDPVKDYLPTLG